MTKNKAKAQADQVQTLALDNIQPGNNDRQVFKAEALEELALSITEHGLAQPITVRPLAGGRYEIVAGERRWRAHKLYTARVEAGTWPESPKCQPGTIKALVRDLSDEEASGIMLAENVHREDLDPIEEARAYQRRIADHEWSLSKIGRTAKVSPGRINARLKLLALAPALQELVSQDQLALGFAEEISVLDHGQQQQVITWLARQTYQPSRKHVAEFVGQLLEEQMQGQMFEGMFCDKALEVARNEDLRVSDMLTPRADLPPLPRTTGPTGAIIDAYLARLLQDGHEAEASVVMDLWRKLMKCNRAQVKPWDSQVLPLL